MSWKLTDRLVAAAVFVYALVLYLLTVAPTASFWDSGEFIAIAHGLQVSHPPGAPFYMLVGRLFSIVLAPLLGLFTETGAVALAINLVSVLASAFTVLLTYLIIVRLVREWQGAPEGWTPVQRIAAMAGGVIGACTFAATDSFWFNAVEAEVYGLSMFFTAVVVWLIMKWSEQARREEASLAGGQHPFGLRANRYLVLIAYLFGLATGVHLLNLLALFYIVLIFFFQEFDRPEWDARKRWTGILVAGLLGSVLFLLIYPGLIIKLPQWAGESGAPILVLLAVVGAFVFGVYYTHRRQMQVWNLLALSLLMVLIGYSTYTLIFIRSAADPPIDENDPETPAAIVSYLAREQYGSTPLLSGPAFDDRTNQLSQETKTLPRRYSQDPNHWRVYSRYDSDFEYFWEYQLEHMYLRYFLWNFVGRESDIQDARAITGFRFIDGDYEHLLQTPSEQASRNAYYGLPLLLGLLGAFFHFSRDWRRAFSVFILFFVTGIGIIVYLNQPPLQPRERDYSYVASFFAFSLWVGLGATGVLTLLAEALKDGLRRPALLGSAALLFLAVPGWMAVENYDDHDRSGRYIAPEYAYNMLMSLADDAIVFTNGDNDTFPLWYLQEVEGIRRDVRVVNLSLLNTPWYVRQLKNQASRESAPLPISMPDEAIDRLGVRQWQPQDVELPVDVQDLLQASEVPIALGDTSKIENPMRWQLKGRQWGEDFYVLYGADIAALDILRTNAAQGWQRPVYFAVTVSYDGQLDLQNFFQLEGQAWRVVPIRHEEPLGRVVPEITPERLRRFRFTNLADPDVYYDENIRRMVDNYRNIFAQTADRLSALGQPGEARALLDTLMQQVPYETIPGDLQSYLFLARSYQMTGDKDVPVALMQKAEPLLLHYLSTGQTPYNQDFLERFVQAVQFTYLDARDFEAAATFSNRLAEALGDPYRQTPDELRQQYEGLFEDDSTTAATGTPPTGG
ncbi:MAG: DUF2723 domain-containing protein [Rhodothermales bacterium]|nr:DUF2723 domain-containing protein [Rhodothermales bacterium]